MGFNYFPEDEVPDFGGPVVEFAKVARIEGTQPGQEI